MEKILSDIDDFTSPSNMSRTDARKWLDRLATEIDCRLDGIKDDMKNEQDRIGTSDLVGTEPDESWRNTP